jgi:hypothetical protein
VRSDTPELSQLAAASEFARASKILSWLFLLSFMLLTAIAEGVYAAHGIAPSERFQFLKILGGLIFLWYWIRTQCEPYGATFPLDFGWFVGVAAPIVARTTCGITKGGEGWRRSGSSPRAYIMTCTVAVVTSVVLG